MVKWSQCCVKAGYSQCELMGNAVVCRQNNQCAPGLSLTLQQCPWWVWEPAGRSLPPSFSDHDPSLHHGAGVSSVFSAADLGMLHLGLGRDAHQSCSAAACCAAVVHSCCFPSTGAFWPLSKSARERKVWKR